MKFVFFAIVFFHMISAFARQDLQDFVRVRILQNQKMIELNGIGISIQGDEREFQKISIPKPNQTVKIFRTKIHNQIVWKVEFSDSPVVRFYTNQSLFIKAQTLSFGSVRLPLRLILTARKNIDVIGFLPMNDYLYGVVSKEMPASWPKEALKAQAIAARTYTLYMKKEKAKNSYDVENSVLDQVFSKIENLNMNSRLQDAVKAAVDETNGVYLSQKNGLPVKTYYHADCGGQTSSSEFVFGSKGLGTGVSDASCPTNPKARWSFEISKSQLSKKLAHYFQQPIEFFQILKLEKSNVQIGGRVSDVKVTSTSGEVQMLNANDFREKLGFQDLRSTNFQIMANGESIQFQGKGYGHGVGMCQWGTRKMAEKGIDSERILAHYYPELDLNTAKNLQSEKGHRDQNKKLFD